MRHSPRRLARDRHGLDLDVAAPVGLVVAALDDAEQLRGAHAPRALVAPARGRAARRSRDRRRRAARRGCRARRSAACGVRAAGQRARPRVALGGYMPRGGACTTRWPPSSTGRGCMRRRDLDAGALELGAALPQRCAQLRRARRSSAGQRAHRASAASSPRVSALSRPHRSSAPARGNDRPRLVDTDVAANGLGGRVEPQHADDAASRRTASPGRRWAKNCAAFTPPPYSDTVRAGSFEE